MIIIVFHRRQQSPSVIAVRPVATQTPASSDTYVSAEVKKIVESNRNVIDLMPYHDRSPIVFDEVVSGYVKAKGIKYYRHPYDLNTIIFDIIRDFPDSRLGGYAAYQLVINDDTIFNQNLQNRIEAAIKAHPNKPTYRCLLNRYLDSPLPDTNAKYRLEFVKSFISDPESSPCKNDCMEFMIEYSRSTSDFVNEIFCLENLLAHDKLRFFKKKYDEELAGLYSAHMSMDSLRKYETLLNLADDRPQPGYFTVMDELGCRVAVMKCASGSNTAEDARLAEFWQAYSGNNTDALLKYASTGSKDRLYFVALSTAAGMCRGDVEKSRLLDSRILEDSVPFSVVSREAAGRITRSIRKGEDPGGVVAMVLDRIQQYDAENRAAMECILYRAANANKKFVALAEKYMAGYPFGRYMDDIRHELFQYYYSSEPKADMSLRYGFELFNKCSDPDRFADDFPLVMELVLICGEADAGCDLYRRVMPRLTDRATRSTISKLMGLGCLAGLNVQTVKNDGPECLPCDSDWYGNVYAMPATINNGNFTEIMTHVSAFAEPSIVFALTNKANRVSGADLKSIGLKYFSTHPDATSKRILWGYIGKNEASNLTQLDIMSRESCPMNVFVFSRLIDHQPERFAKKIFADDLTSPTRIYRMYCMSKYVNGSASEDEAMYARLFINKDDAAFQMWEHSKCRDAYFRNYILHNLALAQQESGDFFKARNTYSLITACPEYDNPRLERIRGIIDFLMYAYYSKRLFDEGQALHRLEFYELAEESFLKSKGISEYVLNSTADTEIQSTLRLQITQIEAEIELCGADSLATRTLSREYIENSIYLIKKDWNSFRKLSLSLDSWVNTNAFKSEQWARSTKRQRVDAAISSLLSNYENYLYGQSGSEVYGTILELGSLYETVYDLDAHLSMLERYRKTLPAGQLNMDLMNMLALEYERKNDYSKLIAVYESIYNQSRDEKEVVKAAYNLFRIHYVNNNDMLKAVQIADTVYSRYPGSKQARSMISRVGVAYLEKKRPEDAMRQFLKCMQYASDEREKTGIKFSIARCYLQLQKYEKCRAQLEEIIGEATTKDPKSKAHMFIAYTFIMEQKYAQAKSEYETVIRDYPNSDEVTMATEYINKLNNSLKKFK